ncbi:type-2 angiotensin II receptor-like [Lepus europaeus]|uniref:type-2 angiotensin II receptor-like n=1 Tax=Lepus europaeus TaxID=9983 RepID=UPI002B462700|nr:type-2 angiotensin II receptor-like [Lepus europaeus]
MKDSFTLAAVNRNITGSLHLGLMNFFGNSESALNCSYKPPDKQLDAIRILYYFIFVIGSLVNAVAVTLFCCQKDPKKVSSIYIFNLAVADLLLVATLPLWATYYSHRYDWLFGPVMCQVFGSFLTLNMFASIFFITCVSVDRYQSVIYPFLSQRRNPWQASYIVPLVWCMACLSSLPTFYFRDVRTIDFLGVNACIMAFPPEKYAQWSVGIALMKNILGFIIPLIFIATCYFGVRKHLLKTNSYGKNRVTRDQVLKMAAAVALAFIICWLPFHVLTFLDALTWMGVINSCEVIAVIDLALPFAILLGFTNSCVNPFLYCFIGNRFQQKLPSVFRVPITWLQGKRESMSCQKSSSLREMETFVS